MRWGGGKEIRLAAQEQTTYVGEPERIRSTDLNRLQVDITAASEAVARSAPASPTLAFPASDAQLLCTLVLTCGDSGAMRSGTGSERSFYHGVGAVGICVSTVPCACPWVGGKGQVTTCILSA